MRKCPKCSKQYEDDLTICRTCGAILEEVAPQEQPAGQMPPSDQSRQSEPAPVVFEEVQAPELPAGPAWRCAHCGETVPGNFEVCWRCGIVRAELAEPKLADAAPEQPTQAQPPRRCAQCGSSRIVPGVTIRDQGEYSDGKLQVVVFGNPTALFFKERLYGELTADICGRCGHVELRVARPETLYEQYLRSLEAS